jgi:glucose-1-phosphate thymidylyltransferase
MKGIVLAGGTGSRLFPITKGISKQLLPIYDKPMIYYPISVLMLAGIREILIITTAQDADSFRAILGTGKDFGVEFTYCVQKNPDGLAQAFILGEAFIGNSDVCLVLGDNIFYGQGFVEKLNNASSSIGATIFGYQVNDPHRFGVIEFNPDLEVISIEEKPKKPKSNWAATGLYFYDNSVIEIAKDVPRSDRGELEITTVNQKYLAERKLNVQLLGRGFAWLDTGTHDSLIEAGQFVQTLERRQGLKIACLEEIAWRKGWISSETILKISKSLGKTSYGKYLKALVLA